MLRPLMLQLWPQVLPTITAVPSARCWLATNAADVRCRRALPTYAASPRDQYAADVHPAFGAVDSGYCYYYCAPADGAYGAPADSAHRSC